MGLCRREVLYYAIQADNDIMNFEQIVRKIKTDRWWSEESPCNYQQALTAWRAFVHQGKIYGPKHISIAIALYRNDFLFEKSSRTEKLSQFAKVLGMFMTNPEPILDDYKNFLKAKIQLIKIGSSLLAAFQKDNRTLASRYSEFYEAYTTLFTHSVMPECGDVYSDERLAKDLKPYIRKFSLQEVSVILSTYPMLSFMEQERVDFLRMVVSKKLDFQKFSKKYHWIQNNYGGAKFLDGKYFAKASKELKFNKTAKEIGLELASLQSKAQRLRQKQKTLLAELNLPKKLAKTFELMRMMSRWIDERKWSALHAIYYIDTFLFEVSKRTRVRKQILEYLTPQEMIHLLHSGKLENRNEAIQRRKFSVYVYCYDQGHYEEHIFTGKQAQHVFKLFEQKTNKIIEGHVASAPVNKFSGRVQIILNPHKEKFIPGRILVTTMTRPDFVPLMRQASAIITDEGGITSHAAIVSRELGIPCIIGTKTATKSFKTGDKVEMDVAKGIIRKI